MCPCPVTGIKFDVRRPKRHGVDNCVGGSCRTLLPICCAAPQPPLLPSPKAAAQHRVHVRIERSLGAGGRGGDSFGYY